jgi:RHS repeat-associated protein
MLKRTWVQHRGTVLAVSVILGSLFLLGTAFASTPSHPARRLRSRASETIVGQSRTVLPDGTLLFLGGEGPNGALSTATIENPQTGELKILPQPLHHPRAGHTATVLPNGMVMVFGGIGSSGEIESVAESFDPTTEKFRDLPSSGLSLRAYHSATILTGGDLFVAGGISDSGKTIGTMELWHFETNTVTEVTVDMLVPRSKQTATLLADGTVLLWGGFDQNGTALNFGEVFDPQTNHTRLETTPVQTFGKNQAPQLEASLPEDKSADVPVGTFVALRFSEPLNSATVNRRTLALSGPVGLIDTDVVAAEAGMLAFITPQEALAAGTTFTLTVDGVIDSKGVSVPRVLASFTTLNPAVGSAPSPTPPNPVDGDLWVPSASNFQGNWKSGQGQSLLQKLPPLEAAPGVTALAGQALRLNGLPLEGVSLHVGSETTVTDATGRFLLTNLAAGHHALLIDGTTASKQGKTYGIFQVGVDLKVGQTTALTYTIWMTRLDMEHAVTIPSPTTTEAIVSTPLLPGLELHLAPNTVIRDHNGKTVTKISITPIPIDQPPFPLPPGVPVPIYFTIQPGDAYIETKSGYGAEGARLFYPNSHNAAPGTQFNFWNYDAQQKGWYVYGVGTVSVNGKQIVPGPGVEIYEFTGAMVGSGAAEKALGPTAYPPPRAGEPVDLSSGLFVYTKTDLVLPDVIPLILQRTYTSNDSLSRTFGIGAMQDYDIFISGNTNPYTYQELMLPDGARLYFQNYAADGGTSLPDADFVHTASQTIWYGATITWNNATGSGWVLTRRDGMKYFFPEALGASNPGLMAVTGIQDRYGNTVEIDRDAVGNITKVSSPNGRYISFQHDTTNRVTQAQDNLGRIMSYVYDSTGRLSTVTDANNGVTTFTYDSNNNMLTIKDPRGIVYLTNQYDGNERVSQQTLGDGGIYKFAWTSGTSSVLGFAESGSLPTGGSASAVIGFRTGTGTEGYLPLVSEVQVTDPRGVVRDVKFNSTGQMTSNTYALGKPEQQAFIYAYYADNLLQSVTDQLARVTAFQYDANGNTIQVTRLSGNSNAVSTFFSYDPNFSQLTSVTDPLNNTTSITLDNFGNPQTITDPLTHQTTMTFNPAGQPLTVIDALNDKTQFGYSAGDLTSITDPLNRITNRFTDSVGRVVSVTYPAGDVTKLSYNPLNQVLTTTNPVGGATNFTYDGNGNLLTVKDANNHTTTYTYENMDKLATRKDALNRSESYQYDTNGNLTQFTDRRGKVTTYTYDNLNRRIFAGFGTQAGPTYESTINYTWDGGNRLTNLVDSVTGTITRGYDGLDRLTSEQTPQGTVSYTYDAASRRQTMTVAGQTALNYTFDNGNRLTKIVQGTTTVQLGYDNANRRTSLTLANGIVTSYGYDNASELTGLTYKLNSTTLGTLTYSYDMAGRRTTVGGTYARTGLPSAQSTTSYDAANELTKWGTATPTYDSNGNVLSDGTNTYVWNGRNQLASMNMSAQSFQYDPFARRAAKTILSATTNYLYDGVNPVQELAGSTVTANLITGGVDEYLQRTDSSGAASFLTDALGSSVALTNSTGNSVAQYTYDPFGNTTMTGTSASTYQYTGRENDGTGVYFYRARYYSPTVQRFISEDPAFPLSGIDPYTYTLNNPLRWTDPFGLCSTPWQRLRLLGEGLGNLGLGLGKVGVGVGSGAAAPETGGLSLALSYYSFVSAIGNFGSAGADIYGAISGNVDGAENVANISTASTSISGAVTWLGTGNLNAGVTAANIEGLGLFGLGGGLGEPITLPQGYEAASNGAALILPTAPESPCKCGQ